MVSDPVDPCDPVLQVTKGGYDLKKEVCQSPTLWLKSNLFKQPLKRLVKCGAHDLL